MEIARCIMGFAGHMIDKPTRKPPRFPPSIEPFVRIAIREHLERYKPEITVCSAACGGDIIFAEESIKLNIPVCIILPFENKVDFILQSVSFPKNGQKWVKRFNNVIENAKHVFYVNPKGYTSDKDFEDNQHAIIFFLLGIQEILNAQIVNIVLYDSQSPGTGDGGTKCFLELCKSLESSGYFLVHEIIHIEEIRVGRS